ncbi:MAG: glutaredoxin family protein [Candidatus Aenigmarchaeota archaeon]|nr:glutaredoxin family protein [Candidatus Aenigmarchaeota archaeon]
MAKVSVFSTPACSWCVKLKEWLKQQKIEFEDIDVSVDQEKAKYMVEKTGQMSVPVTEIDGEFVIGFDIEKLKELLKIK